MDKVKSEIEKIFMNWSGSEQIDTVRATKEMTTLIIKWLEGKKQKVTLVNYDYKGLFCPYCNTAIPNEEVYIHNQLLTELIGEVR